jgi:hypothetical protein
MTRYKVGYFVGSLSSTFVGADSILTHPDRGRDAGYPAPPAQIRTGPIRASDVVDHI